MIALATPALYTFALIAQGQWSASAGRETFEYRDVARSGPPLDASPVKWVGEGPSLVAVFDRTTPTRVHRINVDLASARSFAYVGPVRRSDASADDRAFRLEGRYEYRRKVFRDRILRGLDPGIGVQIMGRWLSLSRHMSADAQELTTLGTGVTCVAAATFHRWSRWSAEVTWANGLTVLRANDRHSADPLADATVSGGGWLTDLSISGAVRISSHASITGSFLAAGESAMVSHHNQTYGRRRLAVGVTYAR